MNNQTKCISRSALASGLFFLACSVAAPSWSLANQASDAPAVTVAKPAPVADSTPRSFLAEANDLLSAVACAAPANWKPSGEARDIERKVAAVAAHCKALTKAQTDYREKWLKVAVPFFASKVPANLPSKVVYPFAGGDLSTALTVFPNAEEITTISLEPAGDPRQLALLTPAALKKALVPVASELAFLYGASYSVTMNMIEAMRSGRLPTQLAFGLSALWLHDYELLEMRYFTIQPDGSLLYLSSDAVTAIDANKKLSVGKRNAQFGSVEITFRKKGATKKQTYRHILANLDDKHLKAEPGVLKHLEAKGNIAAMTKAASYLLTFSEFATMRQYLSKNVQWMVSDSTGLAPKYGKPDFEYETYGSFSATNMPAGNGVTPVWKAEYTAQPKRDLAFRFGYPDRKNQNHLIIMRRATKKS